MVNIDDLKRAVDSIGSNRANLNIEQAEYELNKIKAMAPIIPPIKKKEISDALKKALSGLTLKQAKEAVRQIMLDLEDDIKV